jgi:hypothetical protein
VKTSSLPVAQQRPAQPTSLIRPGARAGEPCVICGSGRVTTLGMTLTDGTPVSFVSCHNCEHRVWTHQGAALDLPDVLARATKHRAPASAEA